MGQTLVSRLIPQPSSSGTEEANNTDATWWCKVLARVLAVISGAGLIEPTVLFLVMIKTINCLNFHIAVSLISGLFVAISAHPLCIISGLLMMVAGIVVLIFEAPMCCMFLEFTKPIAAFAEKRTCFQKAIIYAVLAIIPFLLCIGLSSLVGCGVVFAAGVFYGLMGLGKKADRNQMMETATRNQLSPDSRPDDSKAGLIDYQESSQYPVRH